MSGTRVGSPQSRSRVGDVAPRVSRFYVVSGCSGSGKSTLIEALARRGEAVAHEPGRRVVREQLEAGGDGLPWANAQRFVELCAERAIADFDLGLASGRRTFFDRSLIDIATAVRKSGLRMPDGLEPAMRTRRYARLAFLSRPWRELFRTDAERRHGFDDAVAEYETLVPAYERHGHEVVFLPRAPVEERVSFVLAAVSSPRS